jgi:hypothetical protein
MYKPPISCRDNHANDGKYIQLDDTECNLGIERYEACFTIALYSLPFFARPCPSSVVERVLNVQAAHFLQR